MIISPTRRAEIFSTPLTALPDLWAVAQSSGDDLGTAQQIYSRKLSGNGAAVQQVLVAGVDELVGWAPWHRSAVSGIADLPTAQLVAGELLVAFLPPLADLVKKGWAFIKKALADAVSAILGAFVEILSIMPVIGQVINIVVDIAMGIADLVAMAKKSEAAKVAESAVRAIVPSVDRDNNWLEALKYRCRGQRADGSPHGRGGDWTSIWTPWADPSDADDDWRRGWGCSLIAAQDPFGGGRIIGPSSDNAWGLYDGGGFTGKFEQPGATPKGFGAIPGTSRIHRSLQIDSSGSTIVDSGQWLNMSSAAAIEAWSLLWSDGPTTWAVDTDRALVAWERYVGGFLADLKSGATCGKNMAGDWKIGPGRRKIIRDFFVRELGVDPGSSDEEVLTTMRPRFALEALRQRQIALAGTTSVAYVNAMECPPALEEEVRQRQADLLGSDEACRIDLSQVSDAVYRANLEFAVSKKGFTCYAAGDIQAPLTGPGTWDPSVPPPEPPPTEAIPEVPNPPRVGAKPPRASGPSSGSDGGAGIGILAAAVLAGLIYTTTK